MFIEVAYRNRTYGNDGHARTYEMSIGDAGIFRRGVRIDFSYSRAAFAKYSRWLPDAEVKGGAFVLPERAARELASELSRFLASKDRRTIKKRIREGRIEALGHKPHGARLEAKAGDAAET
jgi:hypothetical protein